MSKWTLQPWHLDRYKEMISPTPYKAPVGCVAIPLGRDFWTIVDKADEKLVFPFNWHIYPNKTAIYAVSSTGSGTSNRKQRIHRLIMDPPADMIIDHINGNTLDNRRANLRICTHEQNVCNRRDLLGGVRFIPPRQGAWRVVVNNKLIGVYDTEAQAIAARRTALDVEFHKRGIHA